LLYAQRQEVDSLQGIIKQFEQQKNFEQDTTYIMQLHILATYYMYIYPDSTILLGQKVQALSKALQYRRGYLYGSVAILQGKQGQGLNSHTYHLFNEVLALAKDLDEKGIEARTYTQMASVAKDAGVRKDSVMFLYQQALAIRKQLNDNKGLAATLHNIALMYDDFGDYTQAMHYYLEVLKIVEKHNFDDRKAYVTLSIAELRTKQGKNEEAMGYYRQAQAIFKKIGDKRGEGIILHQLGEIEQHKGNLSLAAQYYYQSLVLRKTIKDYKGIAYCYSSLGKYYQVQDSFSKAVEHYVKAIKIKTSIQDITELPKDYIGIGKCLLQLYDYKNAIEVTHKGLFVATKGSFKVYMRDCSQLLSQIYKATKNYDSSLYYFEQFKLYADSLQNQDIERKTAQLQAQYEFEKKEELLKREHEVEKRMYMWLNLLIICMLIGVLAFSIYIYKSRIKLQKSYNNLEQANDTIKIQATVLKQQTQELAHTNQTKDKLFAIIGHDLKSPVASLLGLLNLLSSQSISQEEFVELAEHIEKNLTQVHFTLNNLLEWAKTQLKGIQTQAQTIDLKELATENINLLGETALHKGIILVSNIADTSLAWADKEQINLVFRNLLSNAIKFSQRGDTVNISAQIHTDNYWLITVKDTGVGMSAEITQQLFDRPHSTYGTNGEKGTGLGLTLCKDFVSRNGGKIWVESELGKGTTFFFTIPQNTA
jgi:signal transduction histidine kinase/tetratricopeptide (TPR) repeat protein